VTAPDNDADTPYEQRLPAAPENVARLRHGVARFARDAGASERLRRKVALAVSEACTNAVVHAYRRDRTGSVAVRAVRRGRSLCVEVADEGDGLRPRSESPGVGLGTPLMAILADRLEIADNPEGHGTVVRLTFGL
jgi:anti-sigma regulatory factor (Ser/Thr protein kinase)